MDQLEKIRRHHWKERLNSSNNAKFESDTSQAIEDIASQSCGNLRRLYGGVRGGGGQVCVLYHSNVYKISRLWGATFSLVFKKSLSNSAIVRILRGYFQWCWRFFHNLSTSKVVKKPWKGLLHTSLLNHTNKTRTWCGVFVTNQQQRLLFCVRRLYGEGQVQPPTIQTSVKFRDFEGLYLC